MLQIKVLPDTVKNSFLILSLEKDEQVLCLDQDIFSDDEQLRKVLNATIVQMKRLGVVDPLSQIKRSCNEEGIYTENQACKL